MKDLIEDFFTELFKFAANRMAVYTKDVPLDMMAPPVNANGWFEWKPLMGSFTLSQYEDLEKKFKVEFPLSFKEWHRRHFFLDADCGLVRLPGSISTRPLDVIVDSFENDLSRELIAMKIYPFGSEGNDAGFLVFDGRYPVENNEFPVSYYAFEYNGDIEGLSPVIFSSFSKLLECITYYLKHNTGLNNGGLIKEFLSIDPEGAGKHGVDYWLGWASILDDNE